MSQRTCPSLPHAREGDAIAAACRATHPAGRVRGAQAAEQCEGCTFYTTQVRELSYLESWEDSPSGWPQQCSNTRTDCGAPDWPPVSAWPGGRPIAQWPRLDAGHSDDLTAVRDQNQ